MLIVLSDFGLPFWTPTFELCFTWWIEVGASPSPALGQTLGTSLDRSMCLLFRKAIYFVTLSKYWLVWVVVWSSSLCEAVELSLSGGAVVSARLSSPELYVAAPLGGFISIWGVTGFFPNSADGWIVCITSVGNGAEMLFSQVWRCCCCCSRNPFWMWALLAGRECSWCSVGGGRRTSGSVWTQTSPKSAELEEPRVINLSVAVLEKRAEIPLWAGR